MTMMTIQEKKAWTYYQETESKCPNLSRCGRNLNLLSLQGKLDPCYHRDDTIQMIQRILLRKNKANILLTGVPGCGKTAIVEGLAAEITRRKVGYLEASAKAEREFKCAIRKWEKSEKQGPEPVREIPVKPPLCDLMIIELSLNSTISGTKYRGEFEERIRDMLFECKRNPNIVLFIDELHHMDRIGASEGSVSAAQILKPALARNDIRLIGATTTEEKAILLKDQAFARRMTELEIPQLQQDAALQTARRILENYCQYHNVTTQVSAESLLSQVRYFLPNTVFPDNFINLVDETLAGAVFAGITNVGSTHFNETLSRLSGQLILNLDETDLSQAS